VFDVGGNSVTGGGDFEQAMVTGFNLSVISNATAPVLYAKGYKMVGNNPDPFGSWVYSNVPFAIYDWDKMFPGVDEFYDDETIGFAALAELNRTGVDRPSGLYWPTVRGQRNGETFSYSVKVPTVVRDRIVNCSGALDSFYETPFIGTSNGLVTVSKGNFDDPGLKHTGTASFALDFSGPSGQKVYAARPGTVILMDDSNSTNASEPADGAIGNYILVDHQDSSFGLYYHLAPGSIPVGVGLGTRVGRDTYIGNFGSGKLHFEAGDQCHPVACSGFTGYDSVKVLYDAWTDIQLAGIFPPAWISTHKTCYVPRVGDHF
jgi:Peptidase family M23